MTNVPHHIEISQLICNANQLTGVYMMGNIGNNLLIILGGIELNENIRTKWDNLPFKLRTHLGSRFFNRFSSSRSRFSGIVDKASLANNKSIYWHKVNKTFSKLIKITRGSKP